MPPPQKGRKNPDLLGEMTPDGDVALPETGDDESGEPMPDQQTIRMVYPGEVAGTSMTIAVVLPGDSKESYFRGFFNGRMQEEEDEQTFAARVITNTRELALSQLDDGIDALAEYQAALLKSGRLDRR